MAPAAGLAALAVGVNIAFKAFQNIVTSGKPRTRYQTRCPVRTNTTATKEHQQGFTIDLLFELLQKIHVGLFFRVVFPLDFHRAGDAPDPVQLGPGAHVNKPGTGSQLLDFPGFGWRQGPSIGQAEIVATLACKTQQIGQFAHQLLSCVSGSCRTCR